MRLRIPSLLRKHAWIGAQVLGWLAFSTYRVWEAAASSPAVWQDSEAYRAQSLHGWFTGALWSGVRAPGSPLLFKMVGGSYAHYGIAEAIFGALAWGALSWTVSTLVAPGWRATVMALAVLAFATAPLVVQWDWSALSESPSLSCLALLCACGLWIVRRFTVVRLAGLAVSAAGYVALRDADIWDLGVIGIVLIVAGSSTAMRGAAIAPEGLFEGVRRNLPRARQALLVGATVTAVAGLAGVGADTSHRNVLNIEEVFYVRVFPFPDRVAWFAAHGMPERQAVDDQAAMTSAMPGRAKVVAPNFTDPTWAPLKGWFAQHALTAYALYLATNPAYVLLAPFAKPPLTYDDASGQLSFYSPPGRALAPFETVFAPNWVVVLVMAVLGALVASARGGWRRPAWRLLLAFTVVGLVSMLLAWHGEGQEATRHMVEGDVEVRLGALLMLLLAVLAPGQPLATPRQPEIADEPDSPPTEPLFV